MSDYTLSAHAKTVLAARSIKIEWLERVLAKPERIEADNDDPHLKHALRRIAEHGGRVLRVVYNDAVKPRNIVTAYFDRSQRGKL